MSQAIRPTNTTLSAVPPSNPSGHSRRRVLTGSMGAMLLLSAAEAGPAKAAELDGELLRLCGEWLALEDETDRLWTLCPATGGLDAWAAYNMHTDAAIPIQEWLQRRIEQTPARTPEGLRRKAMVAGRALPADRRDDPDPFDILALSVLADVLGSARS